MPFQIVRNDITKMHCDAIVNAANETLLGGGGVDGAIHRAAGPELLAECETLGGCKTGLAKATGGYRLPCKYVIHTVGPIWDGGLHGEEVALRSCYRESLRLAAELQCTSVAFPLISSGVYRYPKAEALQVATSEIGAFLQAHDMMVYLVVFDRSAFHISQQLRDDIEEFIDQNYVDTHGDMYDRSRALGYGRDEYKESTVSRPGFHRLFGAKKSAASKDSFSMDGEKCGELVSNAPRQEANVECDCDDYDSEEIAYNEAPKPLLQAPTYAVGTSLKDVVSQLDESFSQMLLRKIDEKGMTDAECYKKANIDRKLFSKIRSDVNYRPSKVTAIAFAVALELPFAEAGEMLRKAGYAFSHSNKFDVIVEYFIRKGNYNVYEINEALFEFDQALLGA